MAPSDPPLHSYLGVVSSPSMWAGPTDSLLMNQTSGISLPRRGYRRLWLSSLLSLSPASLSWWRQLPFCELPWEWALWQDRWWLSAISQHQTEALSPRNHEDLSPVKSHMLLGLEVTTPWWQPCARHWTEGPGRRQLGCCEVIHTCYLLVNTCSPKQLRFGVRCCIATANSYAKVKF